MHPRFPTITAAVLLVVTMLPPAAQIPEERRGSPSEIEQILRQFNDDDWKVRSDAFDRLLWIGESDGSNVAAPVKKVLESYPELAERIKQGLIRLLERENMRLQELKLRFEKTGQLIGRDYDTDYYANVIASVVTLKDVRSMNALLGAITTGGMATRTLAGFAPASLEPVLVKTADADPLVRNSALHVLGEMLSPTNRDKVDDPESLSKIKAAFLRAVQDPVPIVRSAGVFGLGELRDIDSVPLLERLAHHDPFFLPGQAQGGKDLYTVRRAAKMALAQLKEKSKDRK